MNFPHKHKIVESFDRKWSYCVDYRKCRSEAAHGNIVTHDICSCGAERLTEINGSHRTTGPWLPGKDDAQGWEEYRNRGL